MVASAAVWATIFAQRIFATRVTQVGSIGVVAEIVDSSGAAAQEGFKVHILSTGAYKGLGAPGTPVPPELLAEVQTIVDGIGREFFGAVRQGRHLSQARLDAVTTGQVWLAPQAMTLGLVDELMTFDDALEATKKMRLRRRPTNANALARERIASVAAELGIEWTA
jgi:protease-4